MRAVAVRYNRFSYCFTDRSKAALLRLIFMFSVYPVYLCCSRHFCTCIQCLFFSPDVCVLLFSRMASV